MMTFLLLCAILTIGLGFCLTVLTIALRVPSAVTTGVGTFLLTLGIDGCLAESLWQRRLFHLLTQEVLYLLETVDIGLTDESDGLSVTVCTGRTANTVDIVLCIVGYVIVDDGADIVDVDTTGHDVCSHQHIRLPCLETVHHLVTLLLGEVRVHLVAVDVHLFQASGNLLHLLLLA